VSARAAFAIGEPGGFGVAIALGAAAGAIIMLPLSALGGISDRAETLGLRVVDAPGLLAATTC
jgi:hypothetical protein